MGFLNIFRIIPTEEYLSCVLLLLAMLIGAALEVVGIGAILPLISVMGNSAVLCENEYLLSISEWLGVHNHDVFICICAFGLMIFYFLKNAFLCLSIRMQINFVIRNQKFFSKHLLKEYLFKPYSFHLYNNTASLLHNVNEGALIVFTRIVLPLFSLIAECITSIAIWIMLVVIDSFTATIVAGILGGLIIFIIYFFKRRIGAQGEIQNNCHENYLAWVNQSLGSIKETKTMHTEDFFLTKFNSAYEQYSKARGDFDFLNQLPRLLIEVVVVSGLLVVIMLKVALGFQSEDIVPLLGLLALAAFRLMPSVNRIISAYNTIKFQMPFFYKIYPDFRNIQERKRNCNIKGVIDAENTLPFTSKIDINHLAFSYDNKKNILSNITFSIAKGDFVGIIGSSGAGKTTFVDVLLGLLSPSQGEILVDGVNMSTNVRGWQNNLAYVPQTIYLIDASIKENIALGCDEENIDEAEIEQVLRMAELYDYVKSLPEGIDTIVGERGVRLSGGQRQRIGIARALFRNPNVLVLDEATSALDTETEKSITDTILKMKGKMTIISVAHRISTLEQCDYKVRFRDGDCEIV